jgi:succinoglycan biosynthesis transport protein ExoP
MNYLRLIRDHWPLLLVVPTLVTLFTYFGTKRIEPNYASSATLVVLNQPARNPAEVVPTPGDTSGDQTTVTEPASGSLSDLIVDGRLISTYLELVERRPVLEQAATNLGLTGTIDMLAEKVSATNPKDTQLIVVRAEDGDPEMAAAIANAIAEAFINLSESQIANAGTLALVEPATAPNNPFYPNLPLNLALAFALSLAAAGSLAIILERMNSPVRTPGDVSEVVQLPTLGVIPSASERTWAHAWEDPANPAWADAFRKVRSSLTTGGFGSQYQSLLITSQKPGAGKSLLAANLAIAFANAGQRVLLVDLDLTRPTQHEYFGVPNDAGFADVAARRNARATGLAKRTAFANLSLVPAGPFESNPEDALAPGLPEQFLKQAQESYDLVIVDGPSLSQSSATGVLSSSLDASLLVIVGGKTSESELRGSVEELTSSHAILVGVIINRSGRPHSIRVRARAHAVPRLARTQQSEEPVAESAANVEPIGEVRTRQASRQASTGSGSNAAP